MLLPFTITIPANTIEKTLMITENVQPGIIKKIYVDIPSGWAYTAGFQIEINKNIIVPTPTSSEKYITGNNTNLELDILRRIEAGVLRIYGINYDDSYDHSCIIIIELLTPEEIKLLKYLSG